MRGTRRGGNRVLRGLPEDVASASSTPERVHGHSSSWGICIATPFSRSPAVPTIPLVTSLVKQIAPSMPVPHSTHTLKLPPPAPPTPRTRKLAEMVAKFTRDPLRLTAPSLAPKVAG